MKVYVAASHKGTEYKQQIEELCTAVRKAGLVDFCFNRDVLRYRNAISDPKEMWSQVRDEIGACDALLVDVSGHPTSGRLVEMGIAYSLRKPVIVIERKGTHHKELFYGISSEIIKYSDYEDLAKQLKKFDSERNFNLTDRLTMFAMFLTVGAVICWEAALYFVPSALVIGVIYWLFIRHFFTAMRVFDRVVIYIPLFAAWLVGAILLRPIDMTFAVAWTIVFWAAALIVLRKIKFSL